MAIFALSQRTTSGTAATAAWEIRTAATAVAKVVELGFSQTAATASVFGIGRPGAIGVTPTSPQNFVAEESANQPTSLTTAAVAWGTGPTVPTNFLRRYAMTATIGQGWICSFPVGAQIAVSNSLVLWVIATASVGDAYAIIDE